MAANVQGIKASADQGVFQGVMAEQSIDIATGSGDAEDKLRLINDTNADITDLPKAMKCCSDKIIAAANRGHQVLDSIH